MNVFFNYPVFHGLEILATFLLVVALHAALGPRLVYAFPLFLLYRFDPTRAFLDYPLSIVATA